MLDQPHHDPSARYVSNPRPALGETVEIRVELPATGPGGGPMPVSASWLRGMRDGEQFWAVGRGDGHHLVFELTCTQAVMNYRFHLETDHGPRWLSGAGLIDHDPTDRDDFRLLTTGGAPEWVPDIVWYQIFPDRFATTGRHRHDDHPTDTSWAQWADWDDPVAGGPRGDDPALRRRPRRHHRASRTPGRPRCRRHLPHTGVPGTLESPLRRRDLRHGRSGARRRRRSCSPSRRQRRRSACE